MSRLLLVDDELDFLEATARALGRRGFIVASAKDGEEALTLLNDGAFDVAVLDVRLPGMSGAELFRRIHALRPGLPVILLTGHGTVHQAFETVRDGVFEYLTKPCDVEKLARVAQRAVAATTPFVAAEPGCVVESEIHLLLVDDDLDFLESVGTALRRRGMAVTVASDPVAALGALSETEIDVAVLDVGLDGIELMKKMKTRAPTVEVILLTGRPMMSDALVGVRQGAFDFLTKPQTIEALAGRIREACEARRRILADP